jgi:hypothetical protein
VRGANGDRRDNIPFRSIPERGKVTDNATQSPFDQRRHVFHDDVARSKKTDDPGEL